MSWKNKMKKKLISYFYHRSGDEAKINIFNFIAPIYSLFYERQKRHFFELMYETKERLFLDDYENAIDIGCGTGALCNVLNTMGLKITGVDAADGMLEKASKKKRNNTVEFIYGNVLDGLPFDDKSFDISFACHVAHGIDTIERKQMYKEMSRITKHLVVIHDYNEKKSLLISLIESLENGDYFNFIKTAKEEMADNFSRVDVVSAGKHAALYICVPYDKK